MLTVSLEHVKNKQKNFAMSNANNSFWPSGLRTCSQQEDLVAKPAQMIKLEKLLKFTLCIMAFTCRHPATISNFAKKNPQSAQWGARKPPF